jgi:hypothetical protein
MAQVLPRRPGLNFAGFFASGGLGTPPIVCLPVITAQTLAMFEGDALTKASDGSVYPATAGDTNCISHVMVSVKQYKDAGSGAPRTGAYLPAATAYTGSMDLSNRLCSLVLCIPTDGCLFEIEIPTAAATRVAAQALVGQTVNLLATAGTTANGQSGHTTDTVANFKAPGSATSGQLLLVGIPQYDLMGRVNDPTATYWKGTFRVNPALLGSYI